MRDLKYFLTFWIIFHIVINIKTHNPIKSQYTASICNSSMMILYFFLIQFFQFSNKTNNILFFLAYYVIDINYYLWYFLTDADVKLEGSHTKNERWLYSCHHILGITLLYLTYNHMTDPKVFYYANIIIVLFEISTFFLDLEFLFKKKIFFKESFIIFRCIILNYFLYKFICKEKFLEIKSIHKKIGDIFLSILSIGNLLYISQ